MAKKSTKKTSPEANAIVPVGSNVGRRANKAAPKAPAAHNAAPGADAAPDIDSLVAQLREANSTGNRSLGKKIRRRLRAAGHRGGLRSNDGAIVTQPV